MAFSIETRLPFLDYRLVEFVVLARPTSEQLDGTTTKAILRRALGDRIPPAVLDAARQDGLRDADRPVAARALRGRACASCCSPPTRRADVPRPRGRCARELEDYLAGRRAIGLQVWRWLAPRARGCARFIAGRPVSAGAARVSGAAPAAGAPRTSSSCRGARGATSARASSSCCRASPRAAGGCSTRAAGGRAADAVGAARGRRRHRLHRAVPQAGHAAARCTTRPSTGARPRGRDRGGRRGGRGAHGCAAARRRGRDRWPVLSNIYAAGPFRGLRPRLVCYDFNDHPLSSPACPPWAAAYLRARPWRRAVFVVAGARTTAASSPPASTAPVVLLGQRGRVRALRRAARPAPGRRWPRCRGRASATWASCRTSSTSTCSRRCAARGGAALVLLGPLPGETRAAVARLRRRAARARAGRGAVRGRAGAAGRRSTSALIPFRAARPVHGRHQPEQGLPVPGGRAAGRLLADARPRARAAGAAFAAGPEAFDAGGARSASPRRAIPRRRARGRAPTTGTRSPIGSTHARVRARRQGGARDDAPRAWPPRRGRARGISRTRRARARPQAPHRGGRARRGARRPRRRRPGAPPAARWRRRGLRLARSRGPRSLRVLFASLPRRVLGGQTFVSPDTTAPPGFVRVGEQSLSHGRLPAVEPVRLPRHAVVRERRLQPAHLSARLAAWRWCRSSCRCPT